MNNFRRSSFLLPAGTMVAGLLGAMLHLWLLSAQPEAGHYANDHITNWLLAGLVIVVFVLLIVGTWKLKEANKYSFNYPPSLLRCIGCTAGAVALVVFNILNLAGGGDFLHIFTAVLGILSALSLGFIALCRFRGMHPNFLFHCLIIVHLLLQLICFYRVWSGEPQVQTYAFPLLSFVFLMLSVYHNAMFDYNCGSRRGHSLTHLMAIFLCCIAFVGSDHPWMYLCYIFWMMMDLCDLTPMPSSRKKGA